MDFADGDRTIALDAIHVGKPCRSHARERDTERVVCFCLRERDTERYDIGQVLSRLIGFVYLLAAWQYRST